jgi:hypothetical protein
MYCLSFYCLFFCLFLNKSFNITEIPLLSSSPPSLLYPLLSSSPPPPPKFLNPFFPSSKSILREAVTKKKKGFYPLQNSDQTKSSTLSRQTTTHPKLTRIPSTECPDSSKSIAKPREPGSFKKMTLRRTSPRTSPPLLMWKTQRKIPTRTTPGTICSGILTRPLPCSARSS